MDDVGHPKIASRKARRKESKMIYQAKEIETKITIGGILRACYARVGYRGNPGGAAELGVSDYGALIDPPLAEDDDDGYNAVCAALCVAYTEERYA
jgi:hypothetical protein